MNDDTPGLDDGTTPVIKVSSADRRSIAINGLFILVALYAIYFAAAVLVPLTLALLLSMLFAPVIRALDRLGLPPAFGAALTVVATLAVVLTAIYGLSGSAREWVERVPQNFFRIEELLQSFKEPIEKLKDATERVERATEVAASGKPLEVRVDRPGFAEQFLTGTPRVVTSIGVVIMLLYLLLASGDAFLRKTVAVIPAFRDKIRMVEIIRSIQADISYYLIMLTLLNVGMGVIVGAVCWAIGLPNPILWGVIVALLSYAPLVGSAVIGMILTFVGLLSFSEIWIALLPVGTYLVVMFCVMNIALPRILGNRLTLSPLAIFLSIVFWGWMWGVVGALVAVPLLATFKIVSDRVDSLQPVSEFLSP